MNKTHAFARQQFRLARTALLALCLIALGTAIGVCSEPKGGEWSSDYESAVENSKSTGRPIMLVFTGSDWCIWCQRLDRDIFAKPEFSKLVAKTDQDRSGLPAINFASPGYHQPQSKSVGTLRPTC